MNLKKLFEKKEIQSHLSFLTSRLSGLDTSIHKYNTFGTEMTLDQTVEEILRQVRCDGDAAVSRLLEKIDGVKINEKNLLVTPDEFKEAASAVSAELEKTLQLMNSRIEAYAKWMMPAEEKWMKTAGTSRTGVRYTPIEKIGAYVPGGLAGLTPLISTVLMNLIPARVAGVKEITVATPPMKNGKIHPALLRACEIAGASYVYKAGGAQAVAAMAYGTESIPASVKITGPGNAFVQQAKRRLFGKIDIDMMAGPSEVAVIADENAQPEWIAADLLAQAEHDRNAASVLFTPSKKIIEQVYAEIEKQIQSLPKSAEALLSLNDFGALCLVKDLDEACEVSNLMAPEHLEIHTDRPAELLPLIKNAGAIFLGASTPEAVGDYLAGPSHTLPTCAAAKFASGINVFTYLKSSSLIEWSKEDLQKEFSLIASVARAENLEAHARSAESRAGRT